MKPAASHAVSLLSLVMGVLGIAASGSLPADPCEGEAGATMARCTDPSRFPGCDNGQLLGSAEGTVRAGSASMGLADAVVDLDITYKVDVDPVERGCISRLHAYIYVMRESGVTSWSGNNSCLMDVTFDTNGSGRGVLSAISLYANSFCPGFLDADEGYYEVNTDQDAWFGGATHVQDGDRTGACVEEAFTLPAGPFTLRRDTDGRQLQVSFENVTLYGSYTGDGQTEARCPVVP